MGFIRLIIQMEFGFIRGTTTKKEVISGLRVLMATFKLLLLYRLAKEDSLTGFTPEKITPWSRFATLNTPLGHRIKNFFTTKYL